MDIEQYLLTFLYNQKKSKTYIQVSQIFKSNYQKNLKFVPLFKTNYSLLY